MGSSEEKDSVKILADSLRDKKGVPWHVAKLELPSGEGTFVEYFRGKDFLRYFLEHPDKIAETVLPNKSGKSVDDQARDLLQLFLKRKFIRKADRKFKRPRPGQKRLVKYPRTLEPVSASQASTEEGFYAWTYDRPSSIWHFIGLALVPLIVIGACLFPLSPWWVRVSILYLLVGLMGFITSVILIRYLVFLLVWVVTGHSFWVLPNLLSDEVAIADAFRPVVSFTAPQRGQLLSRAVCVAAAAGVGYLLHTHSPDAEVLAARARRAQESLADYLDLYGKHRGRLAGSSNSTTTTSSS